MCSKSNLNSSALKTIKQIGDSLIKKVFSQTFYLMLSQDQFRFRHPLAHSHRSTEMGILLTWYLAWPCAATRTMAGWPSFARRIPKDSACEKGSLLLPHTPGSPTAYPRVARILLGGPPTCDTVPDGMVLMIFSFLLSECYAVVFIFVPRGKTMWLTFFTYLVLLSTLLSIEYILVWKKVLKHLFCICFHLL